MFESRSGAPDFPRGEGEGECSPNRVWDASGKSLGNLNLMTHEEDTAVRAVSPPSMYHQRSIRGTLPDASEEVFVFPLPPMSAKEGKPLGRRG